MKRVMFILLIVLVSGNLFAEKVNVLDSVSPKERKYLSTVWLETANAYFVRYKMKDAKALYLFAIELYPMGDTAAEARKLLEVNFAVTNPYQAEESYQYFVKRADILTNELYKLNNYLMGLEAKLDKDVLYNVAILYYNRDDKRLAKQYLQDALKAGLSLDTIDQRMKDLLE